MKRADTYQQAIFDKKLAENNLANCPQRFISQPNRGRK
ncbi:hypothetical protein CEXT_184251, partial [Caerostris extrusa]